MVQPSPDLEAHRDAVARNPTHADSWEQLGQALMGCGQHSEAVNAFMRAVGLRPENATFHNLLGVAFARSNRSAEALAEFDESSRLDPCFAPSHQNRGTALAERGDNDGAVSAFLVAIQLDPEYIEARQNLGIALRSLDRKADAAESFRRVLSIAPDHVGALNNLGLTLTEMRRPGEACALLKHCLRLRPDFADAHNNLGLAQLAEGRMAEAETSFERALTLDPKFSSACNNLATALKEQGRIEEAIGTYELAVRMAPEAPSAHWNMALAMLQAGDFDRGWREYEWRFRRPSSPGRLLPKPVWDGTDLTGKRILLYREQGLGDSIQFVRFAESIKALGATVILEMPAPLSAVLSTCRNVDEFFVEGQTIPPFDFHLSLMSAPAVLKTTLYNVPATVPYISPQPDRQSCWQEAISQAAAGRLKIGIAWQGNPHHQLDRFRSIPLETFKPLSRLHDIQLFSLQRGPGSEQLDRWAKPMKVIELTSRTTSTPEDWADTAAIAGSMDLVISVDTAIAHLSGALAVPTWIILSATPDWRWMLGRADSPWYPTLRLYRQRDLACWNGVFREIVEDLSLLVRT